jgi:hypothetical protein
VVVVVGGGGEEGEAYLLTAVVLFKVLLCPNTSKLISARREE